MENPGTPVPRHVVLLVPGGLALLAGLDAALLRLGLGAPVVSDRWADVHGPLMVLGFVGTLVALERDQRADEAQDHERPVHVGPPVADDGRAEPEAQQGGVQAGQEREAAGDEQDDMTWDGSPGVFHDARVFNRGGRTAGTSVPS